MQITPMDANRTIWTYFNATLCKGSIPIMRSADHGTWLGTLVFDGARRFDGVAPDLHAHCDRVNRSAEALGMTPVHTVETLESLVDEGLSKIPDNQAVYIRPMYWSTDYGAGFINPDTDSTEFCLCLESMPMPAADASATFTTTSFRRPTLSVATIDAKAACLYPNNARMIREAIAKGFSNALVTDMLGNVAESATSNVFMVRDGEVLTPIPNGTFLNGITRQRIIGLLQGAGKTVHETTLGIADFHAADEVFMTGNMTKVTPVLAFDDTRYAAGPIARLAREAYWDWAHSLNTSDQVQTG